MKKIALVVISCLISQGLLGSEEDLDGLPIIDLDNLVDQLKASGQETQKTNNGLLEQDLILTEQQLREWQALGRCADESDPTVASNNSYYEPTPAHSFDGPGLRGLTQVAPHQVTPQPQELNFTSEELNYRAAANETIQSVSEGSSQQNILPPQQNTTTPNDLDLALQQPINNDPDHLRKIQEELDALGEAYQQAQQLLQFASQAEEESHNAPTVGSNPDESFNNPPAHGEQDQSNRCEHCGKCFSQLGHLRTHERIHTGEKPYMCEHCGKSFTQSSALRRHERTHNGEKPYPCQHCGKAFSDDSALIRHERTHTGEKPYTCEICGKSFSQSNDLTTHKRTHTGEKPFACEYCGKSFVRPTDLTRHERIHTGERPYQCKQCDKWFKTSGNLRAHERRHENK